MSSTQYWIRIHTSATDLPPAVTQFLESQPGFDRVSATEFIIRGASADKNKIRDTLSSLLGNAGSVDVNALTQESRP
jgi:hypothetical protein